jgi:hypothetical protein
MPDLTFMAPTCKTGIQVFSRHGKVGYFILQLRLIMRLLAVTVRVFWGMDNHKNILQISKPRGRYSDFLSTFKMQPVPDELNEVDQIDLKYPVSYPSV